MAERAVIPNADEAIIPPEKVRDYLLSASQPVGRFKAVFFYSLGYTVADWERLEADFRALLTLGAETGERTEYGQKYVLRGRITGPAGKGAEVVMIWIILEGESRPRLITAYPGGQI